MCTAETLQKVVPKQLHFQTKAHAEFGIDHILESHLDHALLHLVTFLMLEKLRLILEQLHLVLELLVESLQQQFLARVQSA